MTERKKHGPLAAIALLAAAAVLLAISGTQTARAALTYFSQDYAAQVQMYDIGVTLTENGQDVSWRNYTQRDDVWNETTGTLLQSLLPAGEQLQLGRSYPEAIAVRNTGSITSMCASSCTPTGRTPTAARTPSFRPTGSTCI